MHQKHGNNVATKDINRQLLATLQALHFELLGYEYKTAYFSTYRTLLDV